MAKYPSRCGSSPVSLLKILHCPTSTGGHPWGLSRAERRLGLESVSAVFSRDYLDYPCDLYLYDKKDPKIIQQAKCWRYLFHAARKFDIIHYNYGLGLLPWGFTERWVGKITPGGMDSDFIPGSVNLWKEAFSDQKSSSLRFRGTMRGKGIIACRTFPYPSPMPAPGFIILQGRIS